MAVPPNAFAIEQPLDPNDILDFQVSLSQGPSTADPGPILITGESVASFALSLPVQSIAAGLTIRNDASYPAPVLSGNVVTFWLGIDPTMQGSPMFAGLGITLPIELTVTTNSQPPRVKNRTIALRVASQ